MDAVARRDSEEKPGRLQARKLQTRIRLLKAAYALMSAKGVDETTIQEITDKADVGFGTFYNYFASKEEIAVKVLDCVVNGLGRRNDLANEEAGISCPVQIVANSVRRVAREMMTDPIWSYWLKRQDIMVERMRLGFKTFGIRDIQAAVDAGKYHIVGGDFETAWSLLIWLLAGTIKDIVDGFRPEKAESIMAEAILRVMGVDIEQAHKAANGRLPKLTPLKIDFAFELSSG